MPDLLGKASDWLQGMRSAHLSHPVTYVPRGGAPIPVTAAVGRSTFELQEEAGVLQDLSTADYLIPAADLAAMGREPAEGDAIVDGDRRYELRPVAGAPAWSWSDRNKRTYRVHVKEVGT